MNNTFLRNKIQRQINQNGGKYKFIRYEFDKYGQITENIDEAIEIDGIFHQEIVKTSKPLSESDGARTISIPRTYILCLYEDGEKINIDDYTIISNQRYKVIDKLNLNSYNVAFEISLEMLKDGDEI